MSTITSIRSVASTIGGNPNAAATVQVLNLSTASQIQLLKHQATLLDLEAKKIASTIDVPTLPDDVRAALRNINEPVRLFGENLANVRDRLRYELAKRQVSGAAVTDLQQQLQQQQQEHEHKEEEITKYIHASEGLIQARKAITEFSLHRAKMRLEKERLLRNALSMKRKRSNNDLSDVTMGTATKGISVAIDELEQLDANCIKMYQSLRQMTLEGSQYGDTRAISCICTSHPNGTDSTAINNPYSNDSPIVVTGSWTGSIHVWDGSTASTSSLLTKLGEKTICHEDRIMGMAIMSIPNTRAQEDYIGATTNVLCTTSIDRTAKLWKIEKRVETSQISSDEDDTTASNLYSITELAHLKGHTKRLCRTAFHPMKRHVATTSFDYSWRLWDIETNYEMLLLQDGHYKETYGIGFHPDGSLVSTTDFAGVIQLWDIRTGKSIRHFLGHAKRILNAEFHPTNGFQLVSSGDDGTIKLWDIRQRKQVSSIPAHSNIVTQLRFDTSGAGEYLVSSSFDGTIKIWSTRSWKLLNTLYGHEGKVLGVDILSCHGNSKKSYVPSIVSCGFDKTIKLWK